MVDDDASALQKQTDMGSEQELTTPCHFIGKDSS